MCTRLSAGFSDKYAFLLFFALRPAADKQGSGTLALLISQSFLLAKAGEGLGCSTGENGQNLARKTCIPRRMPEEMDKLTLRSQAELAKQVAWG